MTTCQPCSWAVLHEQRLRGIRVLKAEIQNEFENFKVKIPENYPQLESSGKEK